MLVHNFTDSIKTYWYFEIFMSRMVHIVNIVGATIIFTSLS